jgi:hypothetical protein
MKEFFLHRADKSCWERVDEYVFTNRQFVVGSDDARRYNDNAITKDDEGVDVQVRGLNQQDLSLVMRFLAVREYQGAVNGGIVQSPQYFKIKRGVGTILHEINGGNFRRA